MRLRIAATAVTLALLAAACGNSGGNDAETTTPPSTNPDDPTTTTLDQRDVNNPVDETGVSDDEIKFTSIATITQNPLGTNIGDAFNEGVEAYFSYRNEEGGIYGRQLVLAKKRDDQLGLNQQEAQAAVSEDDSFGVFGASLLFTGAEVLNDAAVPTFVWNIHTEFAGKQAIFGHLGALCFGCAGRTTPYLAQQAGASNVGVLGYAAEQSARCVDGNRLSFEEYGAEAGAELVFSDKTLAFGLSGGIAPQVSEMKDKGVQFITTCMDLNGMKILAEELHKQGMDDVVLHHPNTYNHAFVAANADIFEGDYVIPQFVPFEFNSGGALRDRFFEYTDKLGIEREELTMIGWIVADIAYTGLVKAGPDFDRQKVIDALNQTTDYSADGLIVPIDWTRQHTDPAKDPSQAGALACSAVVQVQDGKLVPAFGTDDAPWTCFPTGAGPLGEPEQLNFVPE